MSFSEAELAQCGRLITWGLAEDLGDPPRDLTTEATIAPERSGSARVVVRSAGVIAGLPILPLIAARLGYQVELRVTDGPVAAKEVVAEFAGPLRAILAGERISLNFLGHLGGIATLTARYVAALTGTAARICDTRKTTPGWRHLEKYAVRIGGGSNHRLGLHDGVLIKDNHLAALGQSSSDPLATAIARAREGAPPGTMIEIEVDTLDQLERALAARPDMVLLDNMDVATLARAVALRDRHGPATRLEASGGIQLDTVRAIAQTGVDRISVGALTHSAPALDVALDYGSAAP